MSARVLLAIVVALVLITSLATALVIVLTRDEAEPIEEERLSTLEERVEELERNSSSAGERLNENDVSLFDLRLRVDELEDCVAANVAANKICIQLGE